MDTNPADYPTRLREAVANGWTDRSLWLARAWAQRDPAGLFAFMIAPEGLDLRGTERGTWELPGACFETWFQQDLPAALEALSQYQNYDPNDPGSRGSNLAPVMAALFKINPEAAMKYAGEHPELLCQGPLDYATLRTLADHAVDFPPGKSRPALLSGVLGALLVDGESGAGEAAARAWLARLDPARRVEALQRLSDAEAEGLATLKALAASSFTEGELSALADAATGSGRAGILQSIAQLRALRDPVAAAAWAGGWLQGLEQHQVLQQILATAAPAQPADASRFLDSLAPGPLRDAALAAVTGKMEEVSGFQTVADWLMTQPQSPASTSALERAAGHWNAKKPDECAAWIMSQSSQSLALQVAKGAMLYSEEAWMLSLAAQMPEPLAVEALRASLERRIHNSRALAEAAALLPAGPIRTAAIADASSDYSRGEAVHTFNQAWLDWASALPTAADRAAALQGTESGVEYTQRWALGIEAVARERLGK